MKTLRFPEKQLAEDAVSVMESILQARGQGLFYIMWTEDGYEVGVDTQYLTPHGATVFLNLLLLFTYGQIVGMERLRTISDSARRV